MSALAPAAGSASPNRGSFSQFLLAREVGALSPKMEKLIETRVVASAASVIQNLDGTITIWNQLANKAEWTGDATPPEKYWEFGSKGLVLLSNIADRDVQVRILWKGKEVSAFSLNRLDLNLGLPKPDPAQHPRLIGQFIFGFKQGGNQEILLHKMDLRGNTIEHIKIPEIARLGNLLTPPITSSSGYYALVYDKALPDSNSAWKGFVYDLETGKTQTFDLPFPQHTFLQDACIEDGKLWVGTACRVVSCDLYNRVIAQQTDLAKYFRKFRRDPANPSEGLQLVYADSIASAHLWNETVS